MTDMKNCEDCGRALSDPGRRCDECADKLLAAIYARPVVVDLKTAKVRHPRSGSPARGGSA